MHRTIFKGNFEIAIDLLFQFALGPFTTTLWSASAKVHVTPFGRLIGNLPIRDMILLD
jgi:hypothetical protein